METARQLVLKLVLCSTSGVRCDCLQMVGLSMLSREQQQVKLVLHSGRWCKT